MPRFVVGFVIKDGMKQSGVYRLDENNHRFVGYIGKSIAVLRLNGGQLLYCPVRLP